MYPRERPTDVPHIYRWPARAALSRTAAGASVIEQRSRPLYSNNPWINCSSSNRRRYRRRRQWRRRQQRRCFLGSSIPTIHHCRPSFVARRAPPPRSAAPLPPKGRRVLVSASDDASGGWRPTFDDGGDGRWPPNEHGYSAAARPAVFDRNWLAGCALKISRDDSISDTTGDRHASRRPPRS
jgi:hypothetical protein